MNTELQTDLCKDMKDIRRFPAHTLGSNVNSGFVFSVCSRCYLSPQKTDWQFTLSPGAESLFALAIISVFLRWVT